MSKICIIKYQQTHTFITACKFKVYFCSAYYRIMTGLQTNYNCWTDFLFFFCCHLHRRRHLRCRRRRRLRLRWWQKLFVGYKTITVFRKTHWFNPHINIYKYLANMFVCRSKLSSACIIRWLLFCSLRCCSTFSLLLIQP